MEQTYFTTAEAAEYLRMSKSSLNQWRQQSKPPEFFRVGSLVRYTKAGLDDFMTGTCRNEVKKELAAGKRKMKAFEHPTEDEVNSYEKECGLNLTGFFNYYESNGWKVGKNNMKNWRAAASGWSKRQGQKGRKKAIPTGPVEMIFPGEKEINPLFGGEK